MKRNEAEELLWLHLNEIKGHKPKREFKFWPTRRWRADFAIRDILIEIDGGSWIQGRHNTGSGSAKDREKHNHAAWGGWRVLRFTPQEVLKGTAIAFIKRVLEG